MKLGFIGDIVGRPGREMVKRYLADLKGKYNIDFIIANGENASHGFGLTIKNGNELFSYGIDIITGGNHTWDKKQDILTLLENSKVLRPNNYPKEVPGSGVFIGDDFAIINLMGLYGMPQVLNPFRDVLDIVEKLHTQNIKTIFIDFHAESTAEKRVLMKLLEGKVSAICGTHTHIGTDDLEISNGTFYVTDVGLTGCRDNVIGMDSKVPIQKALTGLGGHFDIAKKCKKIFQLVVIEIDQNGKAYNGYKIKIYDNQDEVILKAIIN